MASGSHSDGEEALDADHENTRTGSLDRADNDWSGAVVIENKHAKCYALEKSTGFKVKKSPTSSTEKVSSQLKKLKRTLRKTCSISEEHGHGGALGSSVSSGGAGGSSESTSSKGSSSSVELTLPSNVTETQTAELRLNARAIDGQSNESNEGDATLTNAKGKGDPSGASSSAGQYALTQQDEAPGVAEESYSATYRGHQQAEMEDDKHVYINMSELFEKPNVNLLSMLPNNMPPCLAPSQRPTAPPGSDADRLSNPMSDNIHPPISFKTGFEIKDGVSSQDSSNFQYSDPYFPSMMQDSIRELALDGKFTDVTLEVGEHRFLCHRMILAASSKYFRAMFCNDYRERHQSSVAIQGVTSEVMKILIRYAYTSYLEIGRENVQNVLEAASLLQFTRVLEACSNYFVGELAVENAPGIMELAHAHNLHHLLVMARLKCVTCFDQLKCKSDYVVLSSELLESLVSRADLMIHQEEQVFELVMSWCEYAPESRRKDLKRLLQHVKFPLIDPRYFVLSVETHELIRNNPDVFDLLMEARRYQTIGDVTEGSRIVPRQSGLVHQVFVTVGGCDKDDRFVSEVSVLDFQHKTRATLCNLPSSKNSTRGIGKLPADPTQPDKSKWAEFGCVAWKNNILISGGKESRKEAWMFITSLRQWVELGSLNTGRWRHRMVTCCGEVYVVGGYDGLLRVDSLEKYDERENKWREKRHMREGVSSAAVCECNKMIYVIGGGPSVRISSEKVQVYDPSYDLWRTSKPMPEAAKCINAVSHRKSIYVVGGTLRHVLRFDTDAEVWEQVGEQLMTERASCGVTLCSDKIFIVGGRDESGKAISNVSYLDPDNNAIRSECNVPCGISHHGCITLQKHDQIRSKLV